MQVLIRFISLGVESRMWNPLWSTDPPDPSTCPSGSPISANSLHSMLYLEYLVYKKSCPFLYSEYTDKKNEQTSCLWIIWIIMNLQLHTQFFSYPNSANNKSLDPDQERSVGDPFPSGFKLFIQCCGSLYRYFSFFPFSIFSFLPFFIGFNGSQFFWDRYF